MYFHLKNKNQDPIDKLTNYFADSSNAKEFDPMCMFDSPPDNSYDVYLVIHSLDAGQMRSEENQDLLADLASTPFIHLIVSVDNMNSNRLWNGQQLDKLGFYFQRMDTYLPYEKEYANQPELFAVKNDN